MATSNVEFAGREGLVALCVPCLMELLEINPEAEDDGPFYLVGGKAYASALETWLRRLCRSFLGSRDRGARSQLDLRPGKDPLRRCI